METYVFSERLKSLREAIGVSQEEFAAAIVVSRVSLSNYEKGERRPDITVLMRIHEVTGCSISYLLGYSENMKEENDELGAETYLNDDAIIALRDMNIDGFMNYLLLHPSFRSIFDRIRILHPCNFDENEIRAPYLLDYIIYMIGESMKSIVKDYYEREKTNESNNVQKKHMHYPPILYTDLFEMVIRDKLNIKHSREMENERRQREETYAQELKEWRGKEDEEAKTNKILAFKLKMIRI